MHRSLFASLSLSAQFGSQIFLGFSMRIIRCQCKQRMKSTNVRFPYRRRRRCHRVRNGADKTNNHWRGRERGGEEERRSWQLSSQPSRRHRQCLAMLANAYRMSQRPNMAKRLQHQLQLQYQLLLLTGVGWVARCRQPAPPPAPASPSPASRAPIKFTLSCHISFMGKFCFRFIKRQTIFAIFLSDPQTSPDSRQQRHLPPQISSSSAKFAPFWAYSKFMLYASCRSG